MKTPHEILLARHQATTPKLDAVRHSVVNELNSQATKVPSFSFVALFLRCAKTCWCELVFPSRRIWAGLATAWIFIFLINFSLRDHSSTGTVKNFAATSETMSFNEQQKLLNELWADRSLPPDIERPKNFSPKPRTEFNGTFSV